MTGPDFCYRYDVLYFIMNLLLKTIDIKSRVECLKNILDFFKKDLEY